MSRVTYGSRAGGYEHQNNYPIYSRKGARGVCASLDDLTNALKADIDAGATSSVPECTTSELSLGASALVPLHRPHIGPYADGGEQDLPPEFKTTWTDAEGDTNRSYPQTSIQDIVSLIDPRERQIVQRAASRGIIAAIEAMDGFKYSFNNAWGAKDEDGQRFSYICQDSMQNKDRHANGFTRTQKHLKGEGERGVRKPTYDCKGSVSVKCSISRGCVDVYYRHYAIHPTITERKSLPRPRRLHRESFGAFETDDQDGMDNGGLHGRLQAEKSAFSAPPKIQAATVVNREHVSNIGKPLKRKRDSDTPMQPRDPTKPLSLFELLKQSGSAAAPLPPSSSKPANASVHPPPVNYDLPSWQKPPPPPPAPPVLRDDNVRAGPARLSHAPTQPAQYNAQVAPPYQPPYKPAQPPQHQQGVFVPPTPQQQPPRPPQQEYLGLPKPHPQSQGLFTTMKPVAQESLSGYVAYQPTPRAKTSCTNCRYGKKKVSHSKPCTVRSTYLSCAV